LKSAAQPWAENCLAPDRQTAFHLDSRAIFRASLKRFMEIDSRFPSKLDSVSDAPEPLRSAVAENCPSLESVRLLIHAPAFSTVDERSPATVLAVTDSGWVVASETEEGSASTEKSNFSDALFLELTSILLSGQLRICFATVGTSYSATIKFDTVGEEFYREAIDLMLNGIDQTVASRSGNGGDAGSISETWPMKFRIEAERYRPKDQRLLAATVSLAPKCSGILRHAGD
jgi:hypothetical protein